MKLRFVEEIILLLLEDEGGRFIRVPSWSINYALAGAVLMDLALEDRIDTDLDSLVLLDSSPLGDSLLDPTLAEIAASEPHDTRHWVEHIAERAEELQEGPCRGWSTTASSSATTSDTSGCSAPGDTQPSTAPPSARSSCASWRCCSATRSPIRATS